MFHQSCVDALKTLSLDRHYTHVQIGWAQKKPGQITPAGPLCLGGVTIDVPLRRLEHFDTAFSERRWHSVLVCTAIGSDLFRISPTRLRLLG
jgi:hypothetical protein